MSIFLYRLARFSYRRPWVFILTWLLIVGGVLGLAVASGAKISSAITIDGTQSQTVIDQLRTEFPETSGGQGTIVFTAAEGKRLDEGEAADVIRAAMKEISENEYVVAREAQALAAPPTQATAGQQAQQPALPQQSAEQSQMPSPIVAPSPEQQEKKMQEALLKQGMLAPGVLVSADGPAPFSPPPQERPHRRRGAGQIPPAQR